MRSTRRAAPRAEVILAFGEDLNDSQSLKWLVKYFRSDLPAVLARPKPISLSGNPGEKAVEKWVADLSGAIAATVAGGQPVRGVLVHVDSDSPDPDGQRHTSLAKALSRIEGAHPVVPVQCTEAWWFLFPEQVESIRPVAWRSVMPRKPRDVETITSPKSELKQLTRRSGSEYAENDSVRIAEKIATARPKLTGTSKSFERFRASVNALAT